MTDAGELAAHLEDVVRRERADPQARIQDLVRLSGGASRATWSLDVVGGDGRVEPCILQLQVPSGGFGGPGMVGEAALLRAAEAEGVPVAPLLLSGDADAGIGQPFLLSERLEGETIPRRLLRDDRFAAARGKLAAQCGAALAAIHRIDPAVAPGLDTGDRVQRMRTALDVLGDPHPAFELCLRWLDDHRPDHGPATVVHGDFRLGNLLVDGSGLRAVLDWELAHVGDPLEDFGWLCVRSWRFGGAGPVGGFAERAELFEAYERAGGRPVDPAAVHWWEVFGTLAWGVICIVQSRRHLDGHTRSVELATIGRRVAETEYDLLRLLGATEDPGPGSDDREPVPPTSLLHDRPTMLELLAAVRAYLDDEARPALDGAAAFHGAVAGNALAIVERQLAAGDAPERAHAARLAAFGCTTNAELAAAVRGGRLDGDDDRARLAEALLAAAVDKLSVANPRWIVTG